ncbi:hypothetical protein I8751_01820 [Nostocaceae cyanobacterium CENA357]|uniref:Uncharacterized protein n=1 Tax=Atlanticothrix silvestris CENA357 TaxID=1725252 RepID=A0A8J7H692_9CYAN|nr:hypothetical protein [Atlanticothrix silvestris]MBH8551144.1 hypothetical protein [Atlanticothrix silvestris CENA357]
MARILICDFHFSDVETFLHDLAPAPAKSVLGGFPYARVLSIHDGINRKETQFFGIGSNHDNNYNSVDNSDKVSIWA